MRRRYAPLLIALCLALGIAVPLLYGGNESFTELARLPGWAYAPLAAMVLLAWFCNALRLYLHAGGQRRARHQVICAASSWRAGVGRHGDFRGRPSARFCLVRVGDAGRGIMVGARRQRCIVDLALGGDIDRAAGAGAGGADPAAASPPRRAGAARARFAALRAAPPPLATRSAAGAVPPRGLRTARRRAWPAVIGIPLLRRPLAAALRCTTCVAVVLWRGYSVGLSVRRAGTGAARRPSDHAAGRRRLGGARARPVSEPLSHAADHRRGAARLARLHLLRCAPARRLDLRVDRGPHQPARIDERLRSAVRSAPARCRAQHAAALTSPALVRR